MKRVIFLLLLMMPGAAIGLLKQAPEIQQKVLEYLPATYLAIKQGTPYAGLLADIRRYRGNTIVKIDGQEYGVRRVAFPTENPKTTFDQLLRNLQAEEKMRDDFEQRKKDLIKQERKKEYKRSIENIKIPPKRFYYFSITEAPFRSEEKTTLSRIKSLVDSFGDVLIHLNMHGPKMSDAALAALAPCKRLKLLVIGNNFGRLSGSGFAAISKLGLLFLQVDGGQIRNMSLFPKDGFSKLQVLSVRIDSGDIKFLPKNISNLYLTLWNEAPEAIRDNLKQLFEFKKLTDLQISIAKRQETDAGENFYKAALEKIRDLLPNLQRIRVIVK